MARQETKYIVIHCSQTRPSQDIGAKDIDRWHRERGWLKIGYGKVIKRDGTIEQGRGDDDVQAHVKGYNHCSYGLCLVGGAKEENWKEPEDNFTAEQWETLKKTLSKHTLVGTTILPISVTVESNKYLAVSLLIAVKYNFCLNC